MNTYCTSPDCIKHNGYAHAVDWRKVLDTLQTEPSEMHASVIVRALQQAQLYVMQQANSA